jgi:hypothetical protein
MWARSGAGTRWGAGFAEAPGRRAEETGRPYQTNLRKSLDAPNGIRTKPVQALVHLGLPTASYDAAPGLSGMPAWQAIVWSLNRDAWR